MSLFYLGITHLNTFYLDIPNQLPLPKGTCNDPEEFHCGDVIFCLLKLYHMCGCMDLEGWVGGRGGSNGLWEMGQLILSMRPE